MVPSEYLITDTRARPPGIECAHISIISVLYSSSADSRRKIIIFINRTAGAFASERAHAGAVSGEVGGGGVGGGGVVGLA